MKKIFLSIAFFCLLSIIFVPILASAQGPIVPCNGPDCTIDKFFEMLINIYQFIVTWIATPLAVIAILIGGILWMISAGDPNLMGKGKEIMKWAIIGLVLVFGSYLIIDFILRAIGVSGGLSNFHI